MDYDGGEENENQQMEEGGYEEEENGEAMDIDDDPVTQEDAWAVIR